ncbi:hypothetical protein B0H17DRAFT_1340191, partial [Mycena rosella]
MSNLESDNPRPVCSRTLLVEPGRKIFCVPGATLVLMHATGSLSCWDLLTSQRVAYSEIPGFSVQMQTPCMEFEGKALVVGSMGRVNNLVAVSIDYRDRAHVSISHVISPPMATGDAYFHPGSFFINSQVVGVCTATSIISWSMDPGVKVEIAKMEIFTPNGFPPLVCVSYFTVYSSNAYSS